MHRDNTLIYTALISLGVQKAAAESLAKSYDPAEGISPEIYARGAAEAFFYGKGNFTETELRNGNGLSPVLTELQRSTAYRLGQIMNDTRRTNPPYGVEQNEFTAQLDPQLVSAVDALAKLFRIRVRFGNLGGNNGLYHADTGLIELDIAPQHRGASNAFLFSVSHELGHAVKERIGSKAWNAFAQYAVKVKGGEGAVKAKQESAAEYSEYSAAREEVVCDFIGELLSEQTALDDLCTSIKSGAFKLKAARGIVAAWHKLLNLFKGKEQTDAETAALVKRVQEQFGADIETAENAVRQMQQALSEAMKAEKNTTSEGGVRYAKKGKKTSINSGPFSMRDIEIERTYIQYGDTERENAAIKAVTDQLRTKKKTLKLKTEEVSLQKNKDGWGETRTARAHVKEVLEEFIGKTVYFYYKGKQATAYLTRDGINHAASGMNTWVKATALRNFFALVENAEYAYSSKNDIHGSPQKRIGGRIDWDCFVAVVEFEGNSFYVIFKIRTTDYDMRSQIYSIAIERETDFSHGVVQNENIPDEQPNYGTSSVSNTTIAEVEPKVKKTEVKKSVKDDSKDAVSTQIERSSNDKNRTVKASDKDTIDRETSMGYDKDSVVERSAEDGYDRRRRTADISREVPSSSETAQGNSNQFRGTQDIDRRGDRSAGKESRGQKVSVFQYQTATPYQRARIEELISLAFDASEEWRYYLLVSPDIDINSEVMRMYEEGNPRLRDLKETVPGLSEALYEVEAFIRQTTAQQTETAAQSAEQRGDTSLSEASDSEGNRLTKAQRDYFKDSVFRDREGRLLVLYHGSHFESFSVFELFRGIWMTTDKAYAETYAEFRDESEPLDGQVYTDEDLKLYKLYAKAERPANLGEIDGELTEERLRRLAESLHIDYDTLENFFGYGIGKTSVFAVTRTERFLQLAREQGFDSFTATESGVPTYCVFANQNQVALTTNEAPTEHRDIRYSRKDTLDGDGTTATKAEDMPTARETVEAETSQNKQAETVALSNHGTQNDLSHEQHSDQAQPTVHSLLMETDASKVKNTIERKYLKEYQQTAARQLAEQQKLDKLQAELDALPKDNRQTSRARFLRDELIKTKNRLQICQSIQTRLETDSPLTYLITRDIKPRISEAQKTAMPQTKAKTAVLPYGQNSEADLAMGNDKELQEKQHAPLAQTGFKRQYGREQIAVANSGNRGIISMASSHSFQISDAVIDSLATVKYESISDTVAEKIHESEKELLRMAKMQREGIEVCFICDESGSVISKIVGIEGQVSLPEYDFVHFVLHNHPDGRIFSLPDIKKAVFSANVKGIIAIGNNGTLYSFIKRDCYDGFKTWEAVTKYEPIFSDFVSNGDIDGYVKTMEALMEEVKSYGVEFNGRTAGDIKSSDQES